jgi:5-methylcytosine-specific restriction endonuclease McrA
MRLVTTDRPTHRGTSNGNARGSSAARRVRRQWLVSTYRADVDVVRITWTDETQTLYYPTNVDMAKSWVDAEPDGEIVSEVELLPACRCYRCGVLLHEGTVTVDRIIPGVEGGTYRRTNIRPACGDCNSETGGVLGNARKAAQRGGQS